MTSHVGYLWKNIRHWSKCHGQEFFITQRLPHRSRICRYSSVSPAQPKSKKKNKYKHTVNILSSSFPRNPKGLERREIEKEVHKKAKFASLYEEQAMRPGQKYVLHDGPPYANGKLHMGHALNKILKDITLRYHVIKGKSVHFIPGWDCHGLPIEMKAQELLGKSNTNLSWESLSAIDIREKANAFAREALSVQQKSFNDWGVIADWNDIYKTSSIQYIGKELKLFSHLYQEGYIFQSYLPVHFSPSSGSSLAESELVYKNDHKSPSLYLGIPLTEESCRKLIGLTPVHVKAVNLCIWTTTPWTLPANEAICVAKDREYAVVRTICDGQETHYLWSVALLDNLKKLMQKEVSIICKAQGSDLLGLQYHHPLTNKKCPIWDSNHVNASVGTGMVHTAPAHGKEDFFTALDHSHSVAEQMVGNDGCYTAEAGHLLAGKSVLDEGNDSVLEIIRKGTARNPCHIMNLGTLVHSYPYDWRTNKPTMMRASSQWFFDIKKVKEDALTAADEVTFIPERFKKNFHSQIGTRPYWCLSRQRKWGVPIPTFYDTQTKKPITNERIVNHLIEVFEKHGVNAWWTLPEDQLLPPEFVEETRKTGSPLPIKGQDILDIWFDSGASNHCVLDNVQADICMEGVDQTNGWFQSSLLIGVAANKKAPFRKLLMHGFAVDENMEKMSKSKGNVFDPIVLTNGQKNKSPALGVNTLRLWVTQSPATKDVPLGQETIKECENKLLAIRSSFWFILAAIKDFSPDEFLNIEDLRLQEKYILHLIHSRLPVIWDHYENLEYDLAFREAFGLISETISREYLNSIKDILLCERTGSRASSVLTTLSQILPQLLRTVAPILPHLTEEIALHMHPELRGSGVFRDFTSEPPKSWDRPDVNNLIENLSPVKTAVSDVLRSHDISGINSGNSEVIIKYAPHHAETLKAFQHEKSCHHSDLCIYLCCAEAILEEQSDIENFTIEVKKSTKKPCGRCFKCACEMEEELCVRCKSLASIQCK